MKSIITALILALTTLTSFCLTSKEIYDLGAKAVVIVKVAQGHGSGFIVNTPGGDSVILTAKHVIVDTTVTVVNGVEQKDEEGNVKKDVKPTDNVQVGPDNEHLEDSKVVAADKNLDLGVLALPDKLNMSDAQDSYYGQREVDAVPLKVRSTPAEPGEVVYTLSYPEHFGKLLITKGMVTAIKGKDFLFDNAVSSGSSGGAVVDENGEVLGVISSAQKATGESEIVENLNVAVSIPRAGRPSASPSPTPEPSPTTAASATPNTKPNPLIIRDPATVHEPIAF